MIFGRLAMKRPRISERFGHFLRADSACRNDLAIGASTMFKDVLVNLSVAQRRDPACDYAVSVATAFNAHLSGIAFAYDPTVPAIAGGCEVMLPGWIEEERGKAAERAKAAVAKFEAAARREGLSAESRVLDATVRKAPHLFAQIARRFDLSLVQQSDPQQPGHENVIITVAVVSG
jgi:hypothetical protein